MTEQDNSFGKALFGRRWESIAPFLGWVRSAWRRALRSARESGR